MPPIIDSLRDWANGVITSDRSDRIPLNSSPRGRNSYLITSPVGATPAKRLGFNTVNTTAIGASAVVAQYQHKSLASGVFTRYHLTVSGNGDVRDLASDPTGTGIATAVKDGTFVAGPPDFASANNVLYMANGAVTRRFHDGDVLLFGVAAPTTAPVLTGSTIGILTGTYEARVTYYSTTQESSAGPTSSPVTVTSQVIDFSSLPLSAPGVIGRRLYLRNTTTQANFYLAADVPNVVDSTYLNYNQPDTLLVTVGPSTTSNDPPPSSIKYLCWHRSRMFGADDSALYYSDSEHPESWDPDFTEPVDRDNAQKITGLKAFNDVVVIFKERSMYGLYGVDPDTWAVRLISPDIGTTSFRSITTVEGVLRFWSHRGPAEWRGDGPPTVFGEPLIRDTLANVNHIYAHSVVSAPIEAAEVVLYSVTPLNWALNAVTLAWNYRANKWVTDEWNGLDPSSMAVVEDDTGKRWTYFGNYSGQVFRLWDGYVDGVPGGIATGTFVAGATSGTSIGTGAGLYTTGSGLVGRYITVETLGGELVCAGKIASNTGSAVTTESIVAGFTIGTTYRFHIGGPNFEWDTKWVDSDAPFHTKRREFLYVQAEAATGTYHAALYKDFDTTPVIVHAVTIPSGTTSRLRAPFNSKVWQARISNRAANSPLILDELAMRSVPLTTKSL